MFTNIMAVISVARTQAGESMENESGKTDHIVQDSLLVQLLTALHDEPKTLSLEEVNALRRSTPVAVERYVRLMNNPGLLEDLSLNRISKSTFEDLQKSLNFLEIGELQMVNMVMDKPIIKLEQINNCIAKNVGTEESTKVTQNLVYNPKAKLAIDGASQAKPSSLKMIKQWRFIRKSNLVLKVAYSDRKDLEVLVIDGEKYMNVNPAIAK
ncbi:uncharacterized protein DEA37_0003375 [Paragonimus westermani]|uniref:Uncharacterized protein n=1 Tax=Paragonimus westermani TaxID=34504 RepID=A0A5J4P2G4_9TREM|nr:uncharacterized protein DEA37_0003375 [Paragonimus westermani]